MRIKALSGIALSCGLLMAVAANAGTVEKAKKPFADADHVIYMPVKTLGELAARAITAGLDPATPAVAVARATRRDEARIVSTIAELPERLFSAELDGPIVVMIGQTFAGVAIANPSATLPRRRFSR